DRKLVARHRWQWRDREDIGGQKKWATSRMQRGKLRVQCVFKTRGLKSVEKLLRGFMMLIGRPVARLVTIKGMCCDSPLFLNMERKSYKLGLDPEKRNSKKALVSKWNNAFELSAFRSVVGLAV